MMVVGELGSFPHGYKLALVGFSSFIILSCLWPVR